MQDKKILGISLKHFLVYTIILFVSIGFIFCVYIPNEHWSVICVSIGTGGFTSALVGYFIDLANGIEERKTRKRNMVNIVYNYKRCIERLLYSFFRVMTEVYCEKNLDNLYKADFKTLLNNLQPIIENYDNSQYTFSASNNSIVVEPETFRKHEMAMNLMKLNNSNMETLSKSIKDITNQDKMGLLKYYNEDEIDNLQNLASLVLDYKGELISNYYYIFESLLCKQFYKIIGLRDIEKLTFYFQDKNYAIYNQDKLFSQFTTLKEFDRLKAKDFFD